MLFTSMLGDKPFAKDPAVINLNGKYFLYYSLFSDQILRVGIATSDDMENWTEVGLLPITQVCEKSGIGAPGAIIRDNVVHLFYQTYGQGKKDSICHAWSYDGVNFEKDPTNPIYRPTDDWCSGRAIDADVALFKGNYYLYFATRDHSCKIQKIGVASTPFDSKFSRDSWSQCCKKSIVAPEMQWEQECIEAPATVEYNGKLYMFYGGAYNCSPQQIGCAVSTDGVNFEKISSLPLITNGEKGSWNACESGHPYSFLDNDGKYWLFYQGFDGTTWRITKTRIYFDENGFPFFD